MSDSDPDNTVLGKRGRDGQEADQKPGTDATVKVDVAEDESDDDVGPMPVPAGTGNGAAKKKRKSTSPCLGMCRSPDVSRISASS